MNQTRNLFSKGLTLLTTRRPHPSKYLKFSSSTFTTASSLKSATTTINNSLLKQNNQILKYNTVYYSIHNKGTEPVTTIRPNQKRSSRFQPAKKPDDNDPEIEEAPGTGLFNVVAYTTADKYNLEELAYDLQEQDLYTLKNFFSTDNLGSDYDVLYVTAKYPIEKEPRDIFFFREGSVIFWNCGHLEINNILNYLKKYERERYLKPLVTIEREIMPYKYLNNAGRPAELKNGVFLLTNSTDNFYDKYTFSNALATTIKLGIWEAVLDRYIDQMQYITEDLKKGRRIRISRANLLRKTGELFALRHSINLSSDLLDTPDFYWDREELETLYLQLCTYFSITRRTKVMNEKLNHCVELAELVSSNLNDTHHVRLEWMIIILIMVEVAFEMIHYADRYYGKEDIREIFETTSPAVVEQQQ